ncbi:MAG: hypothetical protein JSW47_00180 [Phycisphaerales bacterium]|nr:MAG: hypothetical protein JSW47_00180 [Phycisphaerales bacterium]
MALRADCIVAVTVVFCLTLTLSTGATLAMALEHDHDDQIVVSADPNDPNEQPMPARPFALVLLRDEIDDAIAGQRCVLPVTVIEEGIGAGAGDPVTLSIALMGLPSEATVSIEPNAILPGEVAELTIIPNETIFPVEPNDVDPNYILPPDGNRPVVPIDPEGPEMERHVCVGLQAERGGVRRSRLIEINVLPGEDHLDETAAFYRDLFVPWLAEHHPELGITGLTEWTGTIVKPRILVVMYYLFFSQEWEMGVRWHVMIPPHDWAEIYLRRRSELSSTRAWRIHSVDGQLKPEITELPPEGIFR